MSITVADVAKRAGVSRSTVSYALSGKRSISEATRMRVEAAIADLGFTPNAGARALATSRTMVFGLLVEFGPDEFAPAMMEYVLPITETARNHGYDILMMTEADGASAVRRVTASDMVDGVILLDVLHRDARVSELRSAKQPGVLVGLAQDAGGLDRFDLDFGESARLLVDHLHDLGHERILLISPPQNVYERGSSYAWRFRDATAERAARYGIRFSTVYGEARQPTLKDQVCRVLDEHPDITALIVHNDAIVSALPSVLRERGIRVPEDLSVVSLYSQNFANTFSLPYTAVETAPDVVGRLAVDQLVHRLTSGSNETEGLVRFVAPTVVNRGSTTTPRRPRRPSGRL